MLDSDQLANSNVLLSKKDCSDSKLKMQIDRAHAAIANAIKKFLNEESPALTLEFVEKRVTRKRSGKIYLPFFNFLIKALFSS